MLCSGSLGAWEGAGVMNCEFSLVLKVKKSGQNNLAIGEKKKQKTNLDMIFILLMLNAVSGNMYVRHVSNASKQTFSVRF